MDISSLTGQKASIAKACDKNGDSKLEGAELTSYNGAVKTISGSTCSIDGKTYNLDDSVFEASKSSSSSSSSGGSMVSSWGKMFDSFWDDINLSAGGTSGTNTSGNSTSGTGASGGNYSSVGNANGFSNQYDSLILKYANEYGVDPNLVKAVMRTESSFNSKATSSANCCGLMQLNAKYFKGDLYDPENNIKQGCQYLKSCLDAFGGNESKALMGYNMGIYGAKASSKTSTGYSQKVLSYYNQLKGSGLSLSA
ncbi:MAG: lytic transglycosylase domain-containing protein [Candidatus Gastranaerophilales bacterium]|nr:lytic transglycosylase domain-containing protein [Candidatus Gastranaerophilales bacterium]